MSIDNLRGPPKRVAWTHTGEAVIELLRYTDQSWGIRKDDCVLGIWENDAQEECLRLFAHLIDLRPSTIIIQLRNGGSLQKMLAQPAIN